MFLVDNFIHVFDFLYRTRLGTQFFFVIKFIILLDSATKLFASCMRAALVRDRQSFDNERDVIL